MCIYNGVLYCYLYLHYMALFLGGGGGGRGYSFSNAVTRHVRYSHIICVFKKIINKATLTS